MNGTDTKTNTEVHVVEQLPTPTLSPEPEDEAPPILQTAQSLSDGLCDIKTNGNGALSPSDHSRRTSNYDEAILSDTSEKGRRVPPIRRPGDGRRRSSVSEQEKLLRLSPKQIHELTSEPASIPVRAATPIQEDAQEEQAPDEERPGREASRGLGVQLEPLRETHGTQSRRKSRSRSRETRLDRELVMVKGQQRPALRERSITTPTVMRRKELSQKIQGQAHANEEDKRSSRHVPPPLNLDTRDTRQNLKAPPQERHRDVPSPMPQVIPLPPMSIPTFLSLELSADRPSPLYIYRPSTADFPYESSKIKYDRLVNFLLLPPKLEAILAFGTLACLDAWMHTLTILPLRFFLAVGILMKWWSSVMVKEVKFVYKGLPRLWKRRRQTEASTPTLNPSAEEEPPSRSQGPSASASASTSPIPISATTARENDRTGMNFRFPDSKDAPPPKRTRTRYRHRRTMSTPSALLPSHKADMLKGALVVVSCVVLMRFDASRMYHGIRGQSAIKLYVIYNVLEVCDRLLSALGQDVLECLFSRETLDRNPDGRSKLLRPLWIFVLALVYNVAHATALFYQVITLNVAVNSYSNALLTLLMSNQFVEIKSTVFKRFEKENLFQITCADIVERFQLWLMLLIIAMRNIVEVGGLSIGAPSFSSVFTGGNTTTSAPLSAASILPMSFTIFPKWMAQVLSPFLLVLGSEMVVDWLKHAYITKFNQTKPEVYEKFLDVLAKDYYSDAFVDQNLTRRLGLPVIPLSCLFVRAAIQTYHMFIATHMPAPFPSTSTSLAPNEPPTSSPATTAALAHIDQIFRRALGRSSFGTGSLNSTALPWYSSTWTLDDLIAGSTMLIVFLIAYLFFLAFKLLLGMCLLRVARNRYRGMKERERMNVETGGKRIGGWGVVDVDEEKRRWIYNDDPDALRRLRERDEKGRQQEEKERKEGTTYGHVSRYAMVAKRIW
ncbi:uncharacterized protein N0V89_000265 [Didymosphaeria variabile]|uniref:DUF747-domain-containing protein n=1 Tax=Didymosphaeria variabile TaxID=1932322 RepID=A0A9W8XTY5_9PLEO|nr:uncharacterized protein N0V89_000265 [Didymosphaeria variabile]KAJ4359709.1 hypothetical protein N0V89_000265 [Didymosphaeria variabile]